MPQTSASFVILKQVDSTNNYAMAKVHAGMAKHGDAYFSNHQTEGKGQRGKSWITGEGANLALTVVINPKELFIIQPFYLSVVIALASFDLFSSYAGGETKIKWPNDIYWRDRKAGGILIENNFSGKDWNWAVVGIGININQFKFDAGLLNAVSLKQITGKDFDPVVLAKELHQLIIQRSNELLTKPYEMILEEYNSYLYKKNELVNLKYDNMVFETMVREVSPQGQLITVDAIERKFEFGKIEWIV